MEHDVKPKTFLGIALTLLLLSTMTFAEVITTETNNGNLVMQDVPEIPDSLVASLNRYQNVRSAGFLDWTEYGDERIPAMREHLQNISPCNNRP